MKRKTEFHKKVTLITILNLQPGEQVDAMIMNWVFDHSFNGYHWMKGDEAMIIGEHPPKFSTDISWAVRILEHYAEKGVYTRLHFMGPYWEGRVGEAVSQWKVGPKWAKTQGEAMAMALCLAALHHQYVLSHPPAKKG